MGHYFVDVWYIAYSPICRWEPQICAPPVIAGQAGVPIHAERRTLLHARPRRYRDARPASLLRYEVHIHYTLQLLYVQEVVTRFI